MSAWYPMMLAEPPRPPETPLDPSPYSENPDGSKDDAWIWDELLGDDDADDEYTTVVGEPTKPVNLYGTSEGIIKGWETRRRGGGGAAPPPPPKLTREELAAESAEGGRFDTPEKREKAQKDAEASIAALVNPDGTNKRPRGAVFIAEPTPQLIRTAEVTAHVLADMKAKGMVLPDTVEIRHGTEGQNHPGGLISGFKMEEVGPGGVTRGKFVKDMEIYIPHALPTDLPLDDAVAIGFGVQSEKYKPQDYGDDTRTTYDRFVARTMADIIVHEMGHVQDDLTQRGPIPGSRKLVTGTGNLTQEAKDLTRAALRVSSYALQNRNEFIAEAFTKLYRGETLDADSQALYDKLNGPKVPKR